jgi:aminoglycoside 3-N-acetyltransferase I
MATKSGSVEIRRLQLGDRELASKLFSVMASIFEESAVAAPVDYIGQLLRREDYWVFAGLADGCPIAGLTAFILPLPRSQRAELLIYDLAVQPAFQRQGVGRRLVQAALREASEQGLVATWVPAANEDFHALDFYRAIGGKPTATTIFTFDD